MRKLYFFSIPLFFCLIFLIFRNWFLAPEIIGGDWPYFFDETLKNYSFFFSSWNPFQGNGFGGINPIYSLGVFHGFTVFLSQTLNIPWVLAYKFSWFGLFIGLSIFSSMNLIGLVLPRVTFWQQMLAAMIFIANTYILMVVGGGQMGVALAYSVAPLVLARFIRLVDNFNLVQKNFKFSILNFQLAIVAGLVLALQVMFDPRIAYLTMITVSVYFVFSIRHYVLERNTLNTLYSILYTFMIPIGLTVLLHATWILPILFLKSNPIPEGLTNVDGFRFFSFADFSNTFSLLHPNWPENIFGKTYFLKPEFLMLPIAAYASLLFLNSKFKIQNSKLQLKGQNFKKNLASEQFSNKSILFFALLGLLGAFLAKGVNPPFEQVNQWFFISIPGMNFFRDPTKFYLLIVLSYSMLIPFSIDQIYNWINSKFTRSASSGQNSKLQFKIKNFYADTFLLFAFCFLLFLIRPAVFGELGVTFQKREVPVEYVKLKDFLYSQPEFFRTLWIPRQHRFTYYSLKHIPVEAQPLFKKEKIIDVVNRLRKPGIEEYLSELGIKYIIIPYDPSGEIFVKDRKYDESLYLNVISQLEKIPFLIKLKQFEKIAVFETKNAPKDRLWIEKEGEISYITNDPTNYSVKIATKYPQKLTFSENFHPEWQLIIEDKIIPSQKTPKGQNSFMLQAGIYHGKIIFSANKYHIYGRNISIAVAVLIVFFLLQYAGKKYTIRK